MAKRKPRAIPVPVPYGNAAYVAAIKRGDTEEAAKILDTMTKHFREMERSHKPGYRSNDEVDKAARVEIDKEGVSNAILRISEGKVGTKAEDVAQIQALTETPEMAKLVFGTEAGQTTAALFGYAWHEQGELQGRAFQKRAQRLDTPAQRAAALLEMMVSPPSSMRTKLKNMTPEEVTQYINDQRVRMKSAIKALAGHGITELDLNDPKTIEALMNDDAYMELVEEIAAEKTSMGDKIYEYWRNAILSGIQTNVVNLGGNLGFGSWELLVQRPAEAFFNSFLHVPGAPTFESIKAAYRLMWPNFHKANARFMKTFITEQSKSSVGLDLTGRYAIQGKKGKIIRWPQRLLMAVDDWYKTIYENSLVADYATRIADEMKMTGQDRTDYIHWAINNNDNLAKNMAIEEAARLLFQAKIGNIGTQLIQARNMPGTIGWVNRFVFPFITTPTNIIKIGLIKTPLGTLRIGLEQIKKTIGVKSRYKGERGGEMMMRDTVEQMFAWTATAVLYALSAPPDPNDPDDRDKLPMITGSLRGSPSERRFMYFATPPQSIRIGKRWFSYSRIEPFATALTLIIDGMNTFRSGKPLSREDAKQMLSLVRDKTYLQGIGDIMRGIEDPEQWVKMVSNFGSSWMPNILKQAVRATDPMIRDSRVRSRGLEWLLESGVVRSAQSALPIAAIQQMPRYDHWGNPIRKDIDLLGQPLSDIAWRIVAPIRAQTDTNVTNIDRMIWNFNRAQTKTEDQWFPGTPRPTITLHGKKYDMTNQQFEQFLRTRGKLALSWARKMPWNFNSPTKLDIKRIEKVFERASYLARAGAIRDIIRENITTQMAANK